MIVLAVIVVLLIAAALNPGGDDKATPAADSIDTSTSPPPYSPSNDKPAQHPNRVVVPKMTGLSVDDARDRLHSRGLSPGRIVRKPSLREPGTVIDQGRPGGAKMMRHTAVRLIVAAPPPRVPNVIGLGRSSAKHELVAAGFFVRVTTRRTSSSAPGTVIAESPAAGNRRMPRSAVTITVATKPPPAREPASNCTAGYSPCLPPASDYDCAGGSGDGPAYAYGPIYVTGSDPYGLDADGDGVACES